MATTFDVGLEESGDIPLFCRLVRGRDLVAQKVKIRLQTYLGEWILDASKGLPFFAWMQRKPPDAAAIGAVVRREIETTPGVVRVEDFVSTWTAATATVEVTCTVVTENGDIDVSVSPLGTRANRNPSITLRLRGGPIAP